MKLCDLAACSTQEQQILLVHCLDDLGVKHNVAGERWTRIDIAQLEQAYHLN